MEGRKTRFATDDVDSIAFPAIVRQIVQQVGHETRYLNNLKLFSHMLEILAKE